MRDKHCGNTLKRLEVSKMGSLKKVNSIADEILNKKFKELLLSGNWPEVEYHETDGMHGFNLMKYTDKHSQFAKAIHAKVISAGYEFGIFQNKRDDKYRSTIKRIVDAITVAEVDASDRFKTMWD